MPYDDEMSRRREKREQMRQKQLREQKKLRTMLIMAGVILILCTAGIIVLARQFGGRPTPPVENTPATEAQVHTPVTEATEETGGDSADTGDRSHLLSAACVGLLAACGGALVVKKGRAAK